MIVTGAFFCDAANVSAGGTLNVLGGVWDWIAIANPDAAELRHVSAVVLFEVEASDTMPLRMTIVVRDPSAATIIGAEAEIGVRAGSTHGFAIVPLSIRFQTLGRYVVEFSSSGLPYVLGLEVRQAKRS